MVEPPTKIKLDHFLPKFSWVNMHTVNIFLENHHRLISLRLKCFTISREKHLAVWSDLLSRPPADVISEIGAEQCGEGETENVKRQCSEALQKLKKKTAEAKSRSSFQDEVVLNDESYICYIFSSSCICKI